MISERCPFQLSCLWLMGLVAGLCGCQPRDEFTDVRSERVPAPILETPPYDYEGSLGAIYSGDAFEVFVGNQSHLIRLIGVDCPEPGAEKYQAGRHFVRKIIGSQPVRVRVHSRDEAHMEIGQVWAADQDVGLALIRAGLARYTQESFENDAEYRQAWQAATSTLNQ